MTVETRREIPRSAPDGGRSTPYYEHHLRLRSRPAQQIARRQLRVVSRAAEVIGGMMSGTDSEADDDGAGEWVDAIISEAAREMGEQLGSWRALTQQYAGGIADEQETPMTMTVDVTTPHLFGYIGLLRTLDELAATADGLVGAGLITPGERTDTTRYWRDQVARTGRDIIRIAEEYRGRCQ